MGAKRVSLESLDALSDIDPHELVAGRFRIETEAGVGGTGIVYRALDTEEGRVVALKVLRKADPMGVRRFAMEADALANLDHPAIVRYFAHGVSSEGESYLAMEWIEGESLEARLARVSAAGMALTIADVVALGYRLAGALSAAHALGIVHRDVKPGNVLLAGGHLEQAKLVDFGLARTASSSHGTSSGVILGTLGYIAPEQAEGAGDLDGRADLFALGCVLFRCLTNQNVFEGTVALQVLAKMLLHEPRRVRELRPDVPFALDELIAKLLSKDRSQRPASAASVQAMLEDISVSAQDLTPMSISRIEAPARGAGWLVLAAAVLGAGLLFRSVAPPPPRPPPALDFEPAPALAASTSRAPSPACTSAASDLYQQGLQALHASSWSRAHHLFEQAAVADPSCPQAQFRLVLTSEGALPRPRVRDQLRRAMDLRNALSERDRLVLDAWALVVGPDVPQGEEAFHLLEEGTRRFPHDAELLALTTLRRLLDTNAVRTLETEVERMAAAVAIDPSYADAWQIQARALSRLGRAPDELTALERCIDLSPGAVGCMRQRIRAFRSLGQCAKVVAEARHWISWEPDETLAYRELAVGLASQNARPESIEEALRLRWERLPAAERDGARRGEQARLAAWMGDFEAAAHTSEELAEHSVDALLEVGQTERAANFAERALRRAIGIEQDASAVGTSYLEPRLLAAELQAGELDPQRWRTRSDLWEQTNQARMSPRDRWILRWGPAAGPHLAPGEAMQHAPSDVDESPSTLHPGRNLLDAYEGRLRLYSDDPAGAAPLLTNAARACESIDDPFLHVRTHLWLGMAKEKLGDVAGACDAYRFVIDRWGAAKLPSATAREAKQRSQALSCAR